MHVTSRDAVVSELLLHRPVHAAEVATRHYVRRGHFLTADANRQVNVVARVFGVLQVRKWHWVVLLSCTGGAPERLQGVQGDDPLQGHVYHKDEGKARVRVYAWRNVPNYGFLPNPNEGDILAEEGIRA